jgi:hypothetical protein
MTYCVISDAIRKRAESVRLTSGTIPMLIIAGALKTFLSPTHAPIALQFAVCVLLLSGLGFWLNEGGRQRTDSI